MTVHALPDEPTTGDLYNRAVTLAVDGDLEGAKAWFEVLVSWTQEHLLDPQRYPTREAVEGLVRSNIGYWAGYFGEAERMAVHEVYRAVHPIFGADFSPTPEKALEAGRRMARGEFG